MNIEELRDYCISKPHVTESFPFDETTLVFKVEGKIFLLCDTETEFSINIKCDPEIALNLRDKYVAVQPGYHMNKSHWNTVSIDGSVPDKLIKEWIDHSYWLVVSKLPKINRLQIEKEQYNGE